MGFRYLFLLVVISLNTAWADFSDTNFVLHPLLPADGPFIIEISGDWPTDCHPGEQKPVIREYTGDSVLIEFEIITEHVTCNEVATPYRVLVDMSDVIGSVEGFFAQIEVTVRFGGSEYQQTGLYFCPFCSPVPRGPSINPETGLYSNEELDKQGLILARQNNRMGVYPLIYDESGSSEWLFGGNGVVEDTFFTELVELTGGQCLECPPPNEPTVMNTVGKLSMLMDKEGVIQVKINDGMFREYRPLVFGYGSEDVGGSPRESFPDLSGRWAFAMTDTEPQPNGSLPPTDLLPLVFDVVLESVIVSIPPIVLAPPTPPGSIEYLIRDTKGEAVAQMECQYSENCVIKAIDFIAGDSVFSVSLRSIERMDIVYSGIMLAVGVAARGTAVRID